MLYNVKFETNKIVSVKKLQEMVNEEGAWSMLNDNVSGFQIVNANSEEEAKQKTIAIMNEILNQK